MGFVGETDELHKMRSRVEMDLFYIRHWSLRLDLSILFRTICKSIRSEYLAEKFFPLTHTIQNIGRY